MNSIDKTFYPLIILFFILGFVIGYVAHQPQTEIKVVTNTVEVPVSVEKTTEATASPTSTSVNLSQESVPAQIPDFEVRVFDPEKDVPTQTVQIINWQALPNLISISPGKTVLIKVVEYPDRPRPDFVMGSYKRILGTSGQIIITFNKKGTYDYEVLIPNEDPSINPLTYARGTIKVL